MRRRLAWLLMVILIASLAGIWRSHRAISSSSLDEQAGLNRRIAVLDLNNVEFQEAIQTLSNRTGAKIVVEPLKPTLPVSLHLRDSRLAVALDLLCLEAQAYGTSFHYECKGDGVVHLSAAKEPTIVRVYDVRDLIACLQGTGPGAASPQSAGDSVSAAVCAATNVNDVLCVGGRLIVPATRTEHALVERTLAQLRRPLQHSECFKGLRPQRDATDLSALGPLDRPISEFASRPVPITVIGSDPDEGVGLGLTASGAVPTGPGMLPNLPLRCWLDLAAGRGVRGHDPLFALDENAVVMLQNVYPIPAILEDARMWDIDELIKSIVKFSDAHRFALPPPKGVAPPDFHARAVEDLCRMIENLVAQDTWKENGGGGSLIYSGGRVITVNCGPINQAVGHLLRQMLKIESFAGRGAAAPECVSGQEGILQKLRTPIPELRLENVPLIDAIRTLSTQTQISMVLDSSLQAKQSTEKVRLHFWNIEPHAALRELLRQSALDYSIDDGAIVIGTAKNLDRGNSSFNRIYDIRDLIDEALHFRSRFEKLPSKPPKIERLDAVFGPDRYEETTADEFLEELIDRIMDSVDADSWKENGGNAGAIRSVGGLLIIYQTPENQLNVENFLDTLRAGGSREGMDLVK